MRSLLFSFQGFDDGGVVHTPWYVEAGSVRSKRPADGTNNVLLALFKGSCTICHDVVSSEPAQNASGPASMDSGTRVKLIVPL